MLRKISLTLALGTTLTGCAHTTGGVSASSIPLEPGSYRALGQVKGSDCAYAILGLIPISSGNETFRAVEDALDDIPNTTALVQISADTYSQYWILWSNICTQVTATAVTTQ